MFDSFRIGQNLRPISGEWDEYNGRVIGGLQFESSRRYALGLQSDVPGEKESEELDNSPKMY